MTLNNSKRMMFSCILFGCILAISGCNGGDSASDYKQFFKDPSAEPIKAVIRTTVPLAYAASVAMASVNGTPPSNVLVSKTSSIYPCAATVTITDDDSTLPLQFASYGSIVVLGYWSSADTAILSVSFVDMYAGSNLFNVHHVAAFPVIKTQTGITIVYANVDVDVGTEPTDPATLSQTQIDTAFQKLIITPSNDPSVNLDMDAWVIDVDNAGTTYSISGGGQYIEAGSGSVSVLQLGMANVTMGPGCTQNPVSGLAVLNDVASSDSQTVVATALFSFGAACDGNANVTLATGNYLLSNGKSIPLNLSNP